MGGLKGKQHARYSIQQGMKGENDGGSTDVADEEEEEEDASGRASLG